MKKWTPQEIDILKEWYGKITIHDIVQRYLVDRNFLSIKHKAARLGLVSHLTRKINYITIDSKMCPKCDTTKSAQEFYTSSCHSDNLSSWCKTCVINSKRTERNNNKEKYRTLDHNRYIVNREAWLIFFIKYYGNSPICQICSKELTWQSTTNGNAHNTVNWDHRNEYSASVTMVPSSWLNSHICNNSNQATWLSFDFGILCGSCNQFLPTNKREEWLEKALEYTRSNYGTRV